MDKLPLSLVNDYLAHKQRLSGAWRLGDPVQVVRDVVALHATDPTAPYLSLWARTTGFDRPALDDALYTRRELARTLCMRTTLHVVPGDELAFFHQAYAARRRPADLRDAEALLVQAGLCRQNEATACLERMHRQVLDLVARQGPCTVQEIAQAVPELRARVGHSAGRAYEGEFSVGSRLIPSMCGLGLLVRARVRGTWRSNLYEYARLADWLPHVDLASASPHQAQAWLAGQYLRAFGPATLDDVQWWTGLAKGELSQALAALAAPPSSVGIEGLDGDYLMLAGDARRLRSFPRADAPYVFLLPGLDPYIMAYRDRRRFLAPEHHAHVFDRAGNAMPTLWVNGRVAGGWGQRKDGSVVYGLFQAAAAEEEALLAAEVRRLGDFLGGELLAPRTLTPFCRALAQSSANSLSLRGRG